MPRQTSKSGLAAKLGAEGQKGVQEHRGDETSYDTDGELPGGIEGGVAQLTECDFRVYKRGVNEGEYFFYAAGIVVQPVEAGDPKRKIEGRRTSVMEAICKTATQAGKVTTLRDHLGVVMNYLRMLGADTTEVEDVANLETIAAAIKEVQPYFTFRTWKGEKQTTGPYKDREPRVNHVWGGLCEYDEEGGVVDDVVDETSPEATDEVDDSLTAMGEAADKEEQEESEDTPFSDALQERAEASGIDTNPILTWSAVAAAIIEAEGGEPENPEPEPEPDDTPQKGGVYSFKPPRMRKPVECKVTAVYPGKKTCNLQNLATKKGYTSVPWDKLREVEE